MSGSCAVRLQEMLIKDSEAAKIEKSAKYSESAKCETTNGNCISAIKNGFRKPKKSMRLKLYNGNPLITTSIVLHRYLTSKTP